MPLFRNIGMSLNGGSVKEARIFAAEWDGLSYPTWNAAVEASIFPFNIRNRASCSRSFFLYGKGMMAVMARKWARKLETLMPAIFAIFFIRRGSAKFSFRQSIANTT